MTRVERSAYRRFRAPREDGQALINPASIGLPGLVAANRELAAGLQYDFGSLPLAELRKAARSSLLHAAGAPSNDQLLAARAGADAADRPLILSGHQPELFHPGVWFKNFVLDWLARQSGGIGVNLIIDSDTCRAPSINVPTGDAAAPRVEAVAYDAATGPLPHEQRGVVDADTLASFPERVRGAFAGLVDEPLVNELWPRVVAAAQEGDNLGAAISAARHSLERSWGLVTSEAPFSVVCDSTPFHWFSLDLLQRLDDFHLAHNQALAEYRTAHKIRTPAQPIPDLHRRGGWLEAPFWVWTDNRPTRRPLFARPSAGGLLLSDLEGGEWSLPAGASFDAAAGGLAALRFERGVKIRSRALVTTLYSRLLLADVFIHGIGGAKYDQVGDRMAELFYGFAPPPHATATATLRLPIPHEGVDRRRPSAIAAELRSLEFHPEKHLVSPDASAKTTIEMKRDWIRTAKSPLNAVARHRGIVSANEALQPYVLPRREALLAEQSRLGARLRAAAVLESREYSFCLYPAEQLREQMRAMLPGPTS